MFSALARACACIGAIALGFSTAQASDFFEPRGELTLPMAIGAAMQRNPALQNAAFELHAAEAQRVQAGLRPSPELGVTLENFAGSGTASGTKALESTLMLSQVIELGGKRQRRIEAARLGIDKAGLERQAAQLDVLAEVTRRYIDVAEKQEQLLLSRRAQELARNTLEAIDRRVAAARSPIAERSRAAIALGRATLETQQGERALTTAQRRLAAQWGSTEPRFGDVSTDWFDLPSVSSFSQLVQRLDETPTFLRFASEARLRDAQWQLAMSQAKSDITVGGGLRRFEESGDTGFVVNFSMPLNFANRNQGAIREAAIRREQVAADREAASIRVQADLFEFYQALQTAHAQVSGLREQLIPQAEAALAQTRDAYERGRFSYLELAAAQRELIDLQAAAIAAAATYHRVLAEIERLTNTPMLAKD